MNNATITSLLQRRGLRQFVKFGVVGVSGTLVNLVVFTLLQRVVPHHEQKLQFNLIYSTGFLLGGVSNYFLNRRWTFKSDGHAGKEGSQFLTVSLIALLVSLWMSSLVSPYFGRGHRTWFICVCVGIFINFFLNKFWTFRGR